MILATKTSKARTRLLPLPLARARERREESTGPRLQFCERASLGENSTRVEDEESIALLHDIKLVRDDDGRLAGLDGQDRLHNGRLIHAVEGGGAFVQDDFVEAERQCSVLKATNREEDVRISR